ncbi:transglycosylase domain-containing protein [Streptomyces sp. NPDC127068]|uniref:transglycosylase domain-containing protein n=1 Tax=Streptomyces sp. NPDC127068 TaxID=3347127 RepID=UPI00365DD27A
MPSWRQLLALTFLVCTALVCVVAYVYVTVRVPSPHEFARAEANTYYWSDGSHLVSVGSVNRESLPLAQIPRGLQNAVIATENASFYSDPGVSASGVLRAVTKMASGEEVQGGSTITQQYVKNTFLSQDQTMTRKLRELCLSVKLTRTVSKQDVLEGYLNTSWFGRDAYGVQAAAHAYYGRGALHLDPSQSAFLAVLLKNGSLFDPARGPAHRERAERRWRYVLDRQRDLGLMSAAERDQYTRFPEPLLPTRANALSGQIGYLVDVANKDFHRRTGISPEELGRGGFRIETAFEKDKVAELDAAVADAGREAVGREAVQVGAASIRPEDGAVVAVYGGIDATRRFTNNADTRGVPVGSAFLPFVLAAALEHGVRGTERAGADGRARTPVSLDTRYDPLNGALPPPSAGNPLIRPPLAGTPLRSALASADQRVYGLLAADTGLRTVRDTAVAAGLPRESMAPLDGGLVTGTSTPSAIRLSVGLSTFARGGTRPEPYSVVRAYRRGAEVSGLEGSSRRRAVSTETARQVSDALRDTAVDVLPAGTHAALGRVAVTRTGAGDRVPAVWFAGYTDRLATSVVLFRARKSDGALLPVPDADGSSRAAGTTRIPQRVWTRYMTAVNG